jgi:hypothetical protein
MKTFLFNSENPLEPIKSNIPLYSEKINRKGWINYGTDNLYPEYLKSLLNKSSKHSAIVKGKATLIGGNGFNSTDISTDLNNFIGNPYGTEDLNSILSKCSYDIETYGGLCLNIIWSNDRTKISRINYVDPSKIRISTYKDNWDKVESYLYKDDWRDHFKEKPVEIDGFSTINKESGSQIYYFKEYRPGCEFYAQPEYLAALTWIECEYEIGRFHLSNIKNGFNPNLLINFIASIPSGEEQDMLIRELRRQYEGTLNAGKTIFTFSEDKDAAPIITPINPNNSDEKFIQLNKEVTDGIFVGHRITNPIIFGIKTPGELGGSNEIVDAMRVFQSNYVNSKQKMLENIFNTFVEINGIGDRLVINKHKIDVEVKVNSSDILSILQSTITDDQKRAAFHSMGYDEETIKKLIP